MFVVERRRWAGLAPAKSIRLRGCVRIKSRTLNVSAARPKPHAADLVRIGLSSYRVRAGAFRRAPARKPSDREIEAAPKEMDRTDLANKMRPEFLENGIRAYQNSPKRIRILWIVGGMNSA